jgi:hypothetical protein
VLKDSTANAAMTVIPSLPLFAASPSSCRNPNAKSPALVAPFLVAAVSPLLLTTAPTISRPLGSKIRRSSAQHFQSQNKGRVVKSQFYMKKKKTIAIPFPFFKSTIIINHRKIIQIAHFVVQNFEASSSSSLSPSSCSCSSQILNPRETEKAHYSSFSKSIFVGRDCGW